ncbi:hypothetical protein CXF71_00260 [Colwellia sp. 12G3]|nr:hypothetical protein CXF71_00260 [Colwellia sp. 12G3]
MAWHIVLSKLWIVHQLKIGAAVLDDNNGYVTQHYSLAYKKVEVHLKRYLMIVAIIKWIKIEIFIILRSE